MAENTVWKLPYTAEQIQAAQENLIPIIGENEHWWRWDIDKMQWADTGKSAAPAIIGEFNSNPNLLDNWYFADPINQRGQTEYGAGYAIDRWGGGGNAVVTLPGDGLVLSVVDPATITTHLHQWMKRSDLTSGAYTISVLYCDEDGTLTVGAVTFDLVAGQDIDSPNIELVPGWYFDFYGHPENPNDLYSIRFVYTGTGAASVTVKAVKLEQGSHQTLAHQDEEGSWVLNDPPPNKELELLKCCMSTADPNDTYANNKVTPAAINAVNKSGDTMTGWLYSAIDGNGYGGLAGDVYGAYLEAYQKDWNTRRMLRVTNVQTEPNDGNALLLYNMATNVWRTVLHTANKPSGSFTGNGSSATRTIETGGIGNAILIWGSPNDRPYCIILTRTGGFGWHNGSYTNQYPDNAKFEDGVLTMAYSGNGFNENGTTYYYQVL